MTLFKFFILILFITLLSTGHSLAADKLQGSNIVLGEKEKQVSEADIIKKKYPDAIRTSSGLMYVILKKGDGPVTPSGALVEAHYTGRLVDGTKFDSSVDRGQPLQFIAGTGNVIKGWDEAFLSMKKGEKRILIIPPNLGYGERGMGSIPPNATLIFEVELIYFLQ